MIMEMLKIFAKLEVYQMSEPRLIDANALNKRFDKRIKWLQLDVHDKYSLGLYHGAITDKDLIGEMLTVDAMPVVRCKDCKYWGQDVCSFSGDDESFCTNPDGLDNYAHPEDFCSYGERKEGAD